MPLLGPGPRVPIPGTLQSTSGPFLLAKETMILHNSICNGFLFRLYCCSDWHPKLRVEHKKNLLTQRRAGPATMPICKEQRASGAKPAADCLRGASIQALPDALCMARIQLCMYGQLGIV